MSIVEVILLIAIIGLIINSVKLYLKIKEQQTTIDFLEGEAEASEHGYTALMQDFTNYQVKTDRDFSALEKSLEIKSKNIDRLIEKQQKELPSLIGRIVGQLELAQSITPTNRKV
tara:strand:- start:454 stop:798 length:345 start_codon:yes stop_codon:yes gene_type:complete